MVGTSLKLVAALAALLVAAPIAFVLWFGTQAGWDAWRLGELGLLSVFLTALPLAFARTARQALWFYLPIAAYAAALVAFVPVLGYWPHEGAVVALFATSLTGYLEFLQAFGWTLLFPLLLGLGYAWACFHKGFSALAVPAGWRRAIALGAAVTLLGTWMGSRFLGLASPFSRELFERAYPTAALFDAVRLMPSHDRAVETQRFHAFEAPIVREPEVYVLVLGESSRYGNWQVNGYPRPTSPRLAAYKPDELVSFSDMAAVANLTLNVWPIALSRATMDDLAPRDQEHSVVSLFKEAGYATTWLSNQNSSVRQAFEADQQTFLNYAWQTNWDDYDLSLLPLLDQALDRRAPKQLIVLHLMGSHGDYRFRYPRRLDRFGDHQKTGGSYTLKDRQRMVDHYDNSVLANDELLDRVVKAVEARHRLSSVVFLSDHGENLLDDDRHLYWHGTATSSRYETHVPCFVFPGKRWRELHPDKLAALQANRGKPASQTALFDTMADLAGLDYPGRSLPRSLASARYQPPARRMTMLPDHRLVDVQSLR